MLCELRAAHTERGWRRPRFLPRFGFVLWDTEFVFHVSIGIYAVLFD